MSHTGPLGKREVLQVEAGSTNTVKMEFDSFLEGLCDKAAVILERKLSLTCGVGKEKRGDLFAVMIVLMALYVQQINPVLWDFGSAGLVSCFSLSIKG